MANGGNDTPQGDGNSGPFGSDFGSAGSAGDGAGAAPGGGLGAAGTAAGNAATGITSILPNIQAWFDEWIAKQANSLNQVLNTLWYGTIAVAGISCMAWGLYLLAKDLPGPLQGVADVLDLPAGIAKVGVKGAKMAALL